MNLKNMKDTGRSIDQYRAGDKGIIVYLESSDDKHIFEKWFGDLFGEIEFASISGGRADGGCGRIINHIKAYDQDTTNVQAYGVVDRDALLGKINNNSPKKATYEQVWWEKNDNKFINYKPFGEKIFVLTRWELENYLLHPEVLRKLIKDKTMGKICFSNEKEIATTIIENECDLIAVTLFSTFAGQGGIGRFERYSDIKLWDEVKKSLKTLTDTTIQQRKEEILLFAEDTSDPIERWDKLSRMLDGKRVMKRLGDLLSDRTVSLGDECGILAEYIANSQLIDLHLKEWLKNISS